jgi:hypothetical protein
MLFRVCKIGNTDLICSRYGKILRFHKYQKKWTVVKGTKNLGYLQMKIDDKLYTFHRVIAHAFGILDLNSDLVIDHIDRDKSNNNISNLRAITHHENLFNTNAKGYYLKKCHQKWKWYAHIQLNEKRIYLGRYDKEEDARIAYLEAKKIYHPL